MRRSCACEVDLENTRSFSSVRDNVSIAAIQLQDTSGLKILGLEVKEKHVRDEWGPAIVSQKPPVITPTLNRGTDRNEPTIAAINRDTSERMRDLHSVSNQRKELPSGGAMVLVYDSRALMKNDSSKAIVSFAWAYQASPSLQYTEDEEFLCDVKIGPGETKRVKVISRYPRQKVVDVSVSGTYSVPEKPTLTDIIINQVQFADGTTWQRPDWNATVLLGRALNLSNGKCRAL